MGRGVAIASAFAAAAVGHSVAAQTVPPRRDAAPDVFLSSLDVRGGRIFVGPPSNVTARDGYDNQPAFLPDGRELVFTSVREGGQADIFRYDLATHVTSRVTNTPESEYSPTPMPGGGISVVRVEADSTQRLWRIPLDGGEPRLVLERVRPVGYHAWGDDHTVALFVLGARGAPSTLQIADTRTGRVDTIASNIGRSLHHIPGRREISFVDKADSAVWWIEAVNLDTRAVRRIARALPGAEDYAWLPDGRTILMGRGSALFAIRPGVDAGWRQVADLSKAQVESITRLAVNPRGDRLAFVAVPRPRSP